MVLLVGLVLSGAMLVLFTGSGVIDDLQQERTDASAQVVMEGVDSDLTTLTNTEYSARGHFSLGDLQRNDARMVRDGFLNVTVNRNPSCATNITLSSVRLENDEGQVVGYEAGGVWVGGDNGSAMQTAPDVRYRNGSLDVTVTNITGEVDESQNQAFYNATSSQAESSRRSQRVISGTCARPNNVTLAVQSDFYRAWGTYLEDELDTETDVFPSNRTAVAYLNQSQLPRRADDTRNHVVNMSNASYMHNVSIDGNTIRVTKNTSNDYRTYVEALSKQQLDISQVRRVENAQNVSGPPLDVVFVIDESGSMSYNAGAGPSTDRITAAQNAIQNFVGELNSSRDRVGLVGYSSDHDGQYSNCAGDGQPRPDWAADDAPAWIYGTAGDYLTSSFDEFNSTVEETDSRCGTWGSAGLAKGNVLQHLKSNQTRNQIIIFLSDGAFSGHDTDGAHGPDDAAETRATTTAQQGATLYSVGFGDNNEFNPQVLEDMAETTGGEYHYASNQDELNDVFVDIASHIASTQQIARIPTSTSLQTGNDRTFAPQIAGDTDDIAVNETGGQRYLNINDPTAPTMFSHGFALEDNESVSFNASTYDCAEWRGTGRTQTNDNGTTYQVTRCTNMTSQDVEIPPENATVYTDGDNMTDFLAGDDAAWWQQSVEDAIHSRSDVHLNSTSNVTHMKSNQALVIMNYPNGTTATNRLALLFQTGIAESDARPEGIVNIRVRNVDVS